MEPAAVASPVEVGIAGERVRYEVVGGAEWGPPSTLIDGDDDLLGATRWAADGYLVAPLLAPDELEALRAALAQQVADALEQAGVDAPRPFDLERYHELADDPEVHHAVLAARPTYRPVEELPVPVERIEERVSELVGVEVAVLAHEQAPPSYGLRLVRPGRADHNPPHRDAWLDRLRHTLTAYLPIAGSTARSSLPVLPGSHRWPESDLERTGADATVDGVRFTVPAVTAARHPLELVRPDPRPGQVLLLSAYLVHGGARNLEPRRTRASVELRFARAGSGRARR